MQQHGLRGQRRSVIQGQQQAGLFGLLKPLNVGTIWLLSCLAVKDGPGQRLALALEEIGKAHV